MPSKAPAPNAAIAITYRPCRTFFLSEKDFEEVTEYTENAEIERELRRRAAIPGVPLEYLRFVKEEPRIETDGDGLDTEKENIRVHPCSSGAPG